MIKTKQDYCGVRLEIREYKLDCGVFGVEMMEQTWVLYVAGV